MERTTLVRTIETCPDCSGSGSTPVTLGDARQLRWAWQGCISCAGRGKRASHLAHPASVEGRVRRRVAR